MPHSPAAPTAVVLWTPDEFPPPGTSTAASACCLRSTVAGTRLVVYRTGADRGVAAVLDVTSVTADPVPTAHGTLHALESYLPREHLLADRDLAPVFGPLRSKRRLPDAAADRLRELLDGIPGASPG